MIALAQSNLGSERIRWQQADALDLPFAATEFDVVVCQFGVMFFPDKRAGFREALRVLRPGGFSCSTSGTDSKRISKAHCASRHEQSVISLAAIRFP
jgi:ubiquinone/menaquinone biosynthesis C-methylase UbiE